MVRRLSSNESSLLRLRTSFLVQGYSHKSDETWVVDRVEDYLDTVCTVLRTISTLSCTGKLLTYPHPIGLRLKFRESFCSTSIQETG